MNKVDEMSPAHIAVENENLPALRECLNGGVDINEEYNGLTLLHHAIDAEGDGHGQTGEPLHVDTTAYLLARGADPFRLSTDDQPSTAYYLARQYGHWLAIELFEFWKSNCEMKYENK
jgi:hypothetical protein